MLFITVVVDVVINNPIGPFNFLPFDVLTIPDLSSVVVRPEALVSLSDALVVEPARLLLAHTGLHHVNDSPGVLVIPQLMPSRTLTVGENFAAVSTPGQGFDRSLTNLHVASSKILDLEFMILSAQ